MQLLILILHNSGHMDKALALMMESGIHGGSLLDCEGVLQAMSHNSVEPPPIFGSLRQYLNPERGEMNKILISAVEDGQVDIDEWNVINSRTNDYRDYYLKLSLADKTNGQVHDGRDLQNNEHFIGVVIGNDCGSADDENYEKN